MAIVIQVREMTIFVTVSATVTVIKSCGSNTSSISTMLCLGEVVSEDGGESDSKYTVLLICTVNYR